MFDISSKTVLEFSRVIVALLRVSSRQFRLAWNWVVRSSNLIKRTKVDGKFGPDEVLWKKKHLHKQAQPGTPNQTKWHTKSHNSENLFDLVCILSDLVCEETFVKRKQKVREVGSQKNKNLHKVNSGTETTDAINSIR